jgi:hypothetical protein
MTLGTLWLGTAICGLAQHIEHAAQRRRPDRDADRLTCVTHDESAPQAGRVSHSDSPHGVRVEVLLDLDNEMLLGISVDD